MERFFRNVPAASGLAFVVVIHLSPGRKGILPELLQRCTGMKVMPVLDGTRVRRDCVYVIPPNHNLCILEGVLHLLAPPPAPGPRLPVDFFFRSLALDHRRRSVGVILSGMGTDGTLGLRAIREQAGLTLVEDPSLAKFDGMPRSAIGAGLADIVGAADELPGKLLGCLRQGSAPAVADPAARGRIPTALAKVLLLLRNHTGHDFSAYKRNLLIRRIERRMAIHQLGAMAGYLRYLAENPPELDLLFRELLIGVTRFFRDPAIWEQLVQEALPALLASRPAGHTVRAWVAGCSTGEEAYSLAIALREAAAVQPSANVAFQIFATDLDRDAIETARQGLYPENIAADVSPARLKQFFVREEHGYRVRKEIRETLVFAPQNLVMDPPFTKLDLLICRNLLIYLTPEVQRKLMPLFHYSLLPGGLLLLGNAETVGSDLGLFGAVPGPARIFRRTETTPAPSPAEFPMGFGGPAGAETQAASAPPSLLSLQARADQLILQRHAPAAVLANDRGDLLYVSGRTGKYLEPAPGKANWNLFVMARESLRYDLAAAFRQALREPGNVIVRNLRLAGGEAPQMVDLTVQRLEEPGTLQGLVLIVFTEVAPPAETPAVPKGKGGPVRTQVAKLEQELVRIRTEARLRQDEMQTAQEELRAAIEELQSINEELTTSKEEMQSLNEELQTVNAELQAKVDELSLAGDDMKNLLDSTDIATLFLDPDLNVRRFTPAVTSIFRLIPADAGRPITDLVSQLNYAGLADDVRRVLRRQVSLERTVEALDGRWFTVRIMPYRTLDDRTDGVVITFASVTGTRRSAKAPPRRNRAGQAARPVVPADSPAAPRKAPRRPTPKP